MAYVCAHADYAHWIFLGMLLLAGLNVPLSEDLILLSGGALVSTCMPDHYFHLYAWIFVGCWISGWEAYWIGRLLGPKLYQIRWFSHILNPKRIEKLHYYYEKFGIWTFVVGRFIPGGVRNALFMSSGLGKMPFHIFLLRDLVACVISSNVVFYLGFLFGAHFDTVLHYFLAYNKIAMSLVVIALTTLIITLWIRQRQTYDHPT
jgi:membrane protein DedA with SNARE-associated domain